MRVLSLDERSERLPQTLTTPLRSVKHGIRRTPRAVRKWTFPILYRTLPSYRPAGIRIVWLTIH